jgi:hypothetical protein
MLLSVRERGETVATLRWIHVRLMETIASWVPTTPEMEVKLLFGAHVWDLAQHADTLGKRTQELRMPAQHSLLPVDAYQTLLGELGGVQDARHRMAYFYDGILVALASRYRRYLDRTDALLDAPTVRILDYLTREQARMVSESRDVWNHLALATGIDRDPIEHFLARESTIEPFVVHRGTDARA